MVCPCCVPPPPECEDEDDCEYGECCEDQTCVCSCLSLGGHYELEGMTVEIDGQEFTIRGDNEQDFIEDPECPENNIGGWSSAQSNDDYCVQYTGCVTNGCGEGDGILWQPAGNYLLCISCNTNNYGLIPGNCPFWELVIGSECQECDPERVDVITRKAVNYKIWNGRINMTSDCVPTGEAIDLELVESGVSGAPPNDWSDCEPPIPDVVFSGNPLP